MVLGLLRLGPGVSAEARATVQGRMYAYNCQQLAADAGAVQSQAVYTCCLRSAGVKTLVTRVAFHAPDQPPGSLPGCPCGSMPSEWGTPFWEYWESASGATRAACAGLASDHSAPPAARIIAKMPALITSGSVGQACMTDRNSWVSRSLSASTAPRSPPLGEKPLYFPRFRGVFGSCPLRFG